MTQFDYEAAWDNVVKPAFDALPQDVRDLYERVCEQCADQRQNDDLGMNWPNRKSESHLKYEAAHGPVDSLQVEFEKIPYATLALASRTIYSYGHWSPYPCFMGHGGTWKFSHLADQTLIKKLKHFKPNLCEMQESINRVTQGLKTYSDRHDWPDYGEWFEVHEGALRHCVSTPNSWTWKEIGQATPEILELVSKYPHDSMQTVCNIHWSSYWKDYFTITNKFKMPNDEWARRHSARRVAKKSADNLVTFISETRNNSREWKHLIREGAEEILKLKDNRSLDVFISTIQDGINELKLSCIVADLAQSRRP